MAAAGKRAAQTQEAKERAGRAPTRRDRQRQATLAEIHATTRRLLVERGSPAVTINAVAREMGVSGPALYHYYASHEALVGAVTAGFFQELTAAMEQARDAAPERPRGSRLMATCRAMRTWATAHPAEFGWIFAAPTAPPGREPDPERRMAGQRFERVLLDQVVELWKERPFPAPDLSDLEPSLRAQLEAHAASLDGRLPPGALHVYLGCWIRLYGLLCMEVLHQLDFAFTDLDPVFEECLRDLGAALGLETRARRSARESERHD
ncbi:TetR/AcrR family transcriptional regulator [Streptomyces sp. NPDC048172]|uniref:TetR/AcrR family transcriptional regulator n=1 Tax=Streptomyces sp. NPDC048172 TaxID=3365505 RepID=UPI003722A487